MVGPSERDINIHLSITEDGRGAKEAVRDLDGVDKSADKTAKSLREVDKASGKAGDSLHDTAGDAKLFREEVAATTIRIEELERVMLRTGDRSMRRAIASERSWLQSLKRIPLAEGAKSPFEGIGRTRFGGVPLPAIIAGLTGVAAIGPLLGATVAGVVSGAIGTGGVAGGILMAAREPKVIAAAKSFGNSIADQFFSGGGAFVEPIIQSLDILHTAFEDLDLAGVFAKVAPAVTIIAQGFAGFAKNLIPGLSAAFGRMDAFARAAREGLGFLGASLGQFIDDVTASPGAVLGLEAAFKLLGGTIVFLGKNLKFLADAYGGIILAGEATLNWMEDLPTWFKVATGIGLVAEPLSNLFDGLANGVKQATSDAVNGAFVRSVGTMTNSLADFYLATVDAKTGLIEFNDQVSGMIDDQLALDQANLAVEQGWADVTEAIRENGTALGTGTQAARDNQAAILDQIERLSRQRDAVIKVTGATSDASAAYDDQINKLIALGTEAGISQTKMEDLAGRYTVVVAFQSDMSRWLSQFGGMLPGMGQPGFYFAEGGTTPANRPFVVGERGPELMFDSKQHFVANKRQMMAGVGGGGGQVNAQPFVYGGNNRIIAMVIDDVSAEVQRRGGQLAVLGLKAP